MKLSDLGIGESNLYYFIHYYDESKQMWFPYINKQGYTFIKQEYLIFELTEVKKLSTEYRVFKSVTTRVQ